MAADFTTITVKRATREALGALASYGDSMDDVIKQLIEKAKGGTP